MQANANREIKLKNFTATVYERDYEKKGKTYTEFKFAFYDENNKRQFRTASSWDGIEAKAREVAGMIRTGNSAALSLTATDATVYTQALAALAPCGVALHIAAHEYAEAKALIGNGSLLEAAKLYRERYAVGSDKTVQEVVDEMIAKVESREKKASARYLADLNSRLKPFANAFHVSIASVTPTQIDEYLSQFKGRTRFNHARIIQTLFKFAASKKYVSREVNPLEGIEMAYDDDGDISIFTPEEISKLLAAARPEMIPFIAIGAFAGLRTAEIERLDWSEVQDEHIVVKKGKSKTRSRRLVPILPNLAQWLAPYRKEFGPVFAFAEVGKLRTRVAKAAGVKWKQNALRHSFATYRYATTKNEHTVASETGHSPAKLFSNYRELVTEKAGKAWFSIAPETPANVVPVHSVGR